MSPARKIFPGFPQRFLGWRWPLLFGGISVGFAAGFLAFHADTSAGKIYWLHGGFFLVLALLIPLVAPQETAERGAGPANGITFLRAAMTLPVLVLLWLPGTFPETLLYFIVIWVGIATLLDGADGYLARRTGRVSRFGARFDMEVDALLILLLSLLVWKVESVGIWVLLIGLMRYFFLLGGRVWRWLSAPLFSSRRRQVICVVQTVVLLVALVPAVQAPVSTGIVLLALTALLYSFLVDGWWLYRHSRN